MGETVVIEGHNLPRTWTEENTRRGADANVFQHKASRIYLSLTDMSLGASLEETIDTTGGFVTS